jgi:hypothetical protein
VGLVRELLAARSQPDLPVLDPFCGTGTTLTACAEQGIAGVTVDINPFLRWLAEVKSRAYTAADCAKARSLVAAMARAAERGKGSEWVPPLHQIEKWWDEATLAALSRAFAELAGKRGKARDLAALSFCRTLVDAGNVSFAHQSMSFRKRDAAPAVGALLRQALEGLCTAAAEPVTPSSRQVLLGDSRRLADILPPKSVGCVVTSPPYVNRMSYIRELRPYMYWLRFLTDGRAAGALDWQAIGGTWGSATSNLARWQPDGATRIPFPGFAKIVGRIGARHPLLGRYVEKYFADIARHLASLQSVLSAGARLFYIVGNSKFYDTLLPVEEIYAALLRDAGFVQVSIERMRKRSSKKELFEFVVRARTRGRGAR